MKYKYFLHGLVMLNVIFASDSMGSIFSDYVEKCKSELDFTSIPNFSCKSIQFRSATSGSYLGLDFGESDDFVSHKAINLSVDAVFACRWVGRNGSTNRAVSGEMIIHNRFSGGTCFFALKDTFENPSYPQVPISPVSPTASNAETSWQAANSGCTDCHSAGPYIASPQIVSALARFGLINDGHDTLNLKYYPVDGVLMSTPTLNVCSAKCHVIGGSPKVDSVVGAGLVFGSVVLPSINHVIDDIALTNAMPPTVTSDYRWLNRDNAGSTGDYERVSDFVADEKAGKKTIPEFYCNGKTPKYLEAHEVDKSTIYKFDDNGMIGFQKLYKFNLQDGLICRDRDQPSGIHKNCSNYYTRYKCDGVWTDWQSNDTVADGIEDESRSKFKNLCASPSAIQARYRAPTTEEIYVTHDGPRDRLAQADNNGLKCLNSDQSNGSCKNYVVRFTCE